MTVVSTEHGGGVVEISLADPARRNALGYSTLAALRSVVDDAVAAEARAIVLTAQGPAFSAGADLDDLTGGPEDERYDDAVAEVVEALRSCPAPVVVAVDGACIGAAVDLALACDVVVAGQGARFAVPATRLGILYNPAAVARLHATVPTTALRALLLGVEMDAATAQAVGLVALAVPSGEARSAALELAAAAGQGVPAAVAATKGLLAALDRGDDDLSRWQERRARLLSSADRRNAIGAARRTRGSAAETSGGGADGSPT